MKQIIRSIFPGLYLVFSMLAVAQAPNGVTVVTFQQGQSLRSLAEKHLGDPNLWEEILKSNRLKSASEVKPGMQLTIRYDAVQRANQQIAAALQAIRAATDAGANVFASSNIRQSISLYDEAIANRKAGEWERSFERAQSAKALAEQALRDSMTKRHIMGDAILSGRKGNVESRKTVSDSWRDAPLRSKFVEGERVRTQAQAFAELSFHDGSRIRLHENSQAVIQRMRVDLLEKKRESSVRLETGNAFALLNSDQNKKQFEFDIPGVATQVNSKSFWVEKDASGAKLANYEGEITVTAQGATTVLKEDQGITLAANTRTSPPAALLPKPSILLPENHAILDERNKTAYNNEITFKWKIVYGAVNYWLEVSRDRYFSELVASVNTIRDTDHLVMLPSAGNYYWRVAAIDRHGFPSQFSDPGFFNILLDEYTPFLQWQQPADLSILRQREIVIAGQTETEISLSLNGTPLEVSADGSFRVQFSLREGVNTLALEAKDKAGNVNRFVRTVAYESDAYVPINYDAAMKQRRPKHFVVRASEFTLNAVTKPQASITLQRLATSATMHTFANEHGRFQFTIFDLAAQENFVLSVETPAGYSTSDTIAVEVDQRPPQIILAADLPKILAADTLRVRGVAVGATGVQVNDRQVALREEKFEALVRLDPGANMLRITAEDFAGNLAVLEAQVIADKEPPRLLDHKISAQLIAGERLISISVKAQDESGLKRTADFTLQAGNFTASGFLKFNPASQAYEGVAGIPASVKGEAKLKSVVLEDYYGNKKEYQVK